MVKAIMIGIHMAVFGQDEKWTCSDPIIEADLNMITAARATEYSPASGVRREFLFTQGVEAYKATPFNDEELPPAVKGRIY